MKKEVLFLAIVCLNVLAFAAEAQSYHPVKCGNFAYWDTDAGQCQLDYKAYEKDRAERLAEEKAADAKRPVVIPPGLDCVPYAYLNPRTGECEWTIDRHN